MFKYKLLINTPSYTQEGVIYKVVDGIVFLPKKEDSKILTLIEDEKPKSTKKKKEEK